MNGYTWGNWRVLHLCISIWTQQLPDPQFYRLLFAFYSYCICFFTPHNQRCVARVLRGISMCTCFKCSHKASLINTGDMPGAVACVVCLSTSYVTQYVPLLCPSRFSILRQRQTSLLQWLRCRALMLWHQPTRHGRQCAEEGTDTVIVAREWRFLAYQCQLIGNLHLFVAVESRDPGLLPQHTDPADWLQDRPPHRRLHAHRAVRSETDANFPRTG